MASGNKGVVGIVGLGIMGGAIARNLVERGWRVVGFDIADAPRRDAAEAGVELAGSATEVARAVPQLLTSLPSPKALQAVAAELAGAGLERKVIAEISTFAIDDKLQAQGVLEAAGHTVLDCPLSGTGAQAKTRDLVVYASGDTAAIAAMAPVFADFSRENHDLGAFGNGSRMKYVANLLVAIHNVASAEAMVLGMKAGLDPHQIVKLIASGAGNSRMFEMRAPLMADDHYLPPTMKVSVWQKDMAVIGAFAQALGSPTPLFSATLPIYASAMATGHADEDTASVCAVLEAMAGFSRS